MIRLPGDCQYRLMNDEASLCAFYGRLKEQDLLWVVWPEWEGIDRSAFVGCLMRPEVYALGAFIGEEMAGCLLMRPFGERTLVGEIGVTALRPWFGIGRELFLGAIMFLMKYHNLDLLGFIYVQNSINSNILFLIFSTRGQSEVLTSNPYKGQFRG